MEILRSRAFFGCNQYGAGPAAYLLIGCTPQDVAALSAWSADDWARLDVAVACAREAEDPLSALSAARPPSELSLGGVPAMLAEAVRRTAAAAGFPSEPAVHLASGEDGRYELALPSEEPEILASAGAIAMDLLHRLCSNGEDPPDGCHQIRENFLDLQRLIESRRPSVTQAAILAVARERDIPVVRFDRWPFVEEGAQPPDDWKGLIQLGQGVHGRRLRGADTLSATASTREQLGDRVAMHGALRAAGIPVPARDPELTNLNSARRAVRNAERIGYPVVLKPQYRRSSGGMTMKLHTSEAVAAAYASASQHDIHVVVERQVPGWPHRLLVIGGEVVAVSQISPPDEPVPWARPIPVSALAPEVTALAIRATEVFSLNVAEVTLVTSDPAVPLERVGGAVLGVGTAPDLGLYQADSETLPIAAARRLVSHLFPDGHPSRIPIAAVTGSAGKTTTCRMVARILEERGSTVGLACTDGVYLGRTQVNTGVYSGVSGALQVLLDSRAQVGVLEVSRGTLIERGLGYDWATAAACTKVQAEHLGLNGVETVDDMARVKGLVVERASEVAVVNAQDPRCMQMLSRTRALRHILVSADPCASALQDPLSAGTMAVVLEGPEDAAEIRIWEQSGKHSLLRIDEIPAAWGGAAAHNVENAMFAVAISAGMGIPVEPIRRALRGFQSSPDDSPNRLNIYTKLPFTVVLDRAGTTPGYEALCDFVDRLAPAGRKILGFFGTGDRRDQDLRATAARVAASFDRFVCFDGANLRGRRPMEVPKLMKSVLLANGVADEDVILCPGKQDAVQRILADAKSRDFVVIASGSGFQEVLGWLEEASSAASSAAT